MATKKFTIQFDAQMELSNISSQLEKLQQKMSKMELPKEVSKNFEKSFDKTLQSMAEFENIAKKGVSSLADTQAIERAWKQVVRNLDGIEVSLGRLDFSQIFPKEILNSIKKAESDLDKYINKLEQAKSTDKYQKKAVARDASAEKEVLIQKELIRLRQGQTKAEAAYKAQSAKWNDQTEKEYQAQQSAIKSANEQLDKQKGITQKLLKQRKKLSEEGYITREGNVSRTKQREIANMEDSPEKKVVEEKIKLASETVRKLERSQNAEKDYSAMLKGARDAARANEELKKTLDSSKKAFEDSKTTVTSYEKQLELAKQETDKLNSELKDIATEEAKKEWEELVETIKEITGIDLSTLVQDIDAVKSALEEYKTKELEKIPQEFEDIKQEAKELAPLMDKVGDKIEGVGAEAKELTRVEQEMQNLKQQVLDFFSITNTIQLFKRAVTSALNTVKELDATMTEAAVVTEFDVGDMWEKLPQYSTEAQKLGVSINGMYQATTLYYQQGLKSNEAMALGIETMKMGKIAAMDSADATKAMTAALRGFNMELNETSAVRVNDVYSQLAAVTAADTNQIATAMEKTASIAASANMEFETTAALLAQIIETTQEAPETAGTAMKTIIARFAEVKSLREQGQSTGTDSEGEAIDVNKIQTALRTVGISMDGFFAGTEGLDSILLKLAEKWSDLDFETQRYIATTAAGSRQQSRFIAMMSDYGRTTELVSQAQNSAGASQRQFEKTQDSLASSLTKLKNAWDQFLMGLANNEILKFAVDSLTFIVEGINKVIDAISGGNGLIKSLVSLIGVIGALKLGKSIFDGTGFGKILGDLTGKNTKGFETADKKTMEGRTPGEQINSDLTQSVQDSEQKGFLAGTAYAKGFKTGLSRSGSLKEGLGGGTQAVKQKAQEKKENFKKKGGLKGAAKKAFTKEVAVKRTDSDIVKEQKSINEAFLTSKKGAAEYTAQLGKMEMALDPNDMSEKAMSIRAANEALADGSLTAQECSAKYGSVGLAANQIVPGVQQASTTVQGFTVNMQNVGVAAGVVGGALSLLGGLFESLGWDEGAEVCKTLGTALMGVAAVAPLLGNAFTIAGGKIVIAGVTSQLAWWWVFVIIAAVALLVVGVIALAKAAKEASDEFKLEKLNEQIEELGEVVDEAKQKLEDMAAARDELEKLQDTFDGLTRGSLEWKQALIDNNQKVLELLNTYPQLSQWLDTGIHGELIIEEEAWEGMIDSLQQGYSAALHAQTTSTIQRDSIQLETQVEEAMASAWAKTTKADIIGGLAGSFQAAVLPVTPAGVANTAAGAVHGARDDEMQANLMRKRMSQAEFSETVGGKIVGGLVGSLITAGLGMPLHGALFGAFGTESVEDVEKEQTGGLTYDEFNAFAALAAERGLSMADGTLDQQAAQTLLTDLGYEVEDIEDFMSSLGNLGTSFDELANSALAANAAELARVDAIAAANAQTSQKVQKSEYSKIAEESGAQAFEGYSELVQNKTDDYVDDLDDKNTNSDEAYEVLEKYAEIQGVEVEEVRRQLNQEEITMDSVAKVVAAAEVDESMVKAMENAVDIFERIAKEQKTSEDQQKLKGLEGLSVDRGLGVALKDYEGVKEIDDMAQYIKDLGIEEADAIAMGYDSLSDYIATMEENQRRANESYDKAFSDENTLGQDAIKTTLTEFNKSLLEMGATVGLTVGQTEALTGSLAKVGAHGGDVDQLTGYMTSMLQGISPGRMDAAVDVLSGTDWTSQDSIDATVEALKSLGANIDKELVQQLYASSKAAKSLNLEKLEAQLQQLGDAIEKVTEKAEAGSRIYTKEERDALSEAGVDTGSFVRTGINEYTFMGTTESLLEQLNGSVGEILTTMQGDINEAVAQGTRFEEYFAGDKTVEVGSEEFTRKEMIEYLVNGRAGVYGEGKDYTVGRNYLMNTVKALGLLQGENLESYSSLQLKQVITDSYKNTYIPLEENREKQERFGREEATLTASQYVGTNEFAERYDADKIDVLNKSYVDDNGKMPGATNAEVFREVWESGDFKSHQAQKLMASILGDEADNYEGGLEAFFNDYAEAFFANEALDAAIAQEEGLGAQIEKVTKNLEEQGVATEDCTTQIKNHMLSVRRAEREIDNLNETLEEEADNLDSINENTKTIAIERITKEAQKVFGGHFTEDMVEKNKELFQQLAQGGEIAEAAWEKLSEISLAKFLSTIEGVTYDTQQVNDLFSQIDGLNLKVTGTADFSDIFTVFASLMGGAENVEALLESMNYEVEWEPSGEQTITGPDGTPITVPKYSAKITKLGPDGFSGGGSVSSGGGGSRYENPYDKLHNTLEEINDLLRERERLERRYQKLIEREARSITDIQNSRTTQLKNIEAEIILQEQIIDGRNEQINSLLSKNSKMQKYVQIEELDNGDQSIRVDWAAIEKVRSSSTGEKIDEFYDKLKEYLESIYEAENTIADNQDEIYDLLQEGKDEYFDLEEQVKDALINAEQEKIDALSSINDSINDTNQRILDSMQEQIDQYRQNRDNEKTEQELSDKQRRLAYLQQDTSGANALEIMQLQKELEEEQEDYTDTLIDQKISELQKQNDEAAEQRQRQIDVLNEQLKQYEESGGVWTDVNKLLSKAINEDGTINEDSEMIALLKEANGYEALSEIGQMQWWKDLFKVVSNGFSWLTGQGVLSSFWSGQDIEFTTADGQVVKGKVGEDGKVTAENGSVYEKVQWLGGNQFKTDENFKAEEKKKEEAEEEEAQEEGRHWYKPIKWSYGGVTYDSKEAAEAAAEDQAAKSFSIWKKKHPEATYEDQRSLRNQYLAKVKPVKWEKIYYKTGGLADFTGPAWLDGTKSKPEYILNADQTKAFFNLVDVLGSLQTKTIQPTKNTGDNNYDIDISVESIGSDYDVEQLAEKIKSLIVTESRYRNNNVLK